jgi:hypothetical protein
MISAIFRGLFLPLIYFTVTLITTISIMIKGSLAVGVSVLVASAFSYVGVSSFIGTLMERREKQFRTIDLVGIGALDMILVVVAFGLAYWSDFQISFFEYSIDGFYWVLLGAAVPILITRSKDVLEGWTAPRQGSRTGNDHSGDA